MQPISTVAAPTDASRDRVHSMTTDEWRQIGLSQVAYVTGLRRDDNECDFIVHAADGTAVAVVDDPELAWEFARSRGLLVMSVH